MSCAALGAALTADDTRLTPVHHSITSSQAAPRAVSSSPALSKRQFQMPQTAEEQFIVGLSRFPLKSMGELP